VVGLESRVDRKLRIVGIIFLVLVAGAVSCITAWHYADRRSWATLRAAQASFEKDIGQNLPLGTGEGRAIEFLNAHRMRHGDFEEKAFTAHHEAWYNGATETIEAITTTKIGTSLYDCNIFLEMKFDKDKKLIGYRDRMPCTGRLG
jgi:hypothetical protein